MRIILLLTTTTIVTHYGNTDAGTLLNDDVISANRQSEKIPKGEAMRTRSKRLVVKDSSNNSGIWKDGFFYTYKTRDAFLRKMFELGVKAWRKNTCINFMEDNKAKDKLLVIKTNRCGSHIGRRGGDQGFCLNAKDVTEGIAIHEIGHALGLFHTMARDDRDLFIKLETKNLDKNAMINFEKVPWIFSDVYGLTYDYGSIMHYGELSSLPKCNNTTSAKCVNEGFPHPRNCSICICPSGYGGALCDRRPPGCGADFNATKTRQTITHRVGDSSGLRDQFSFCNFLIEAPRGKKVEVDVQSISRGFDEPGCPRGGVEVKAQEDHKMTGYRFCSEKGTNGPIVSSSNVVPLILFNREKSMQAVFTYRYIG